MRNTARYPTDKTYKPPSPGWKRAFGWKSDAHIGGKRGAAARSGVARRFRNHQRLEYSYLILNLFFTASSNRKISTALNGTCTKDSTKVAPSGIFGFPSESPNKH